ncbi:hypothetical protein HDV04_003681 [Boothiomyces sp. JEL0838]|nr:hypothetical protein HDV04_003681 [Boothiomyces sp. JEL0838]
MSLNVLVLGGVGFIGRNFVAYLIENNLVNSVRVVDKVLPATAYLSAEHKKIFADSRVYDEKVYQLSVTVAKEAAKRKIRAFVEVSTGQVYEAGKKPSAEDGKIKPWTLIAKAKAKAEEEITKIPGLNLIIIRPAIVYGPFDILGITPRLIIGAVYSHLKEEMKFLWTKDLKINTVHVADVVRALWHVSATVEEKGGRVSPAIASPEIYNLADKGDTDQGTVNTFIEKIFNISTGFQGTVVSQFAKLNLESITEDVNEKHLQPWSELCKAGEIANTPLTPYLDRELLKDNALSIDGSKIEKTLNFKYIHPEMTETLVRQVIDEFVQAKIWPAGTTK